jgi:hypothetical protein
MDNITTTKKNNTDRIKREKKNPKEINSENSKHFLFFSFPLLALVVFIINPLKKNRDTKTKTEQAKEKKNESSVEANEPRWLMIKK